MMHHQVDVRKRISGIKDAKGVGSDNLNPLWFLLAGVLVVGAIISLTQRRQRRLHQQSEQRRRAEQTAAMEERLKEQQNKAGRLSFVDPGERPLAESVAAQALLAIRSDQVCALFSAQPGHPPIRAHVTDHHDDGLEFVPTGNERSWLDEGPGWCVRLEGAGEAVVFPVVFMPARDVTDPDGIFALSDGPGARLLHSGREGVELSATVLPAAGLTGSNGEVAAATVLALGINTAVVSCSRSLHRGDRVSLRIALPDEPDSVEFSSRIRSVKRDEFGRQLSEFALEASPGAGRDILARFLASTTLQPAG
ncbi:MAG: hypothetical protein CMJ83_08245 [Planctomycetes bacterium]|nr:hypothetical protein [Planctomycetota bacterium]